MARVVPADELNLIEQVISQHPKGIGISELEKALFHHLPQPLHRRTLQRRLEILLAEKRITTEGESIALVYKKGSGRVDFDIYVPVSKDGSILRDLVRQPVMQRKPVGYHRSFMEDYEPNVSFYL